MTLKHPLHFLMGTATVIALLILMASYWFAYHPCTKDTRRTGNLRAQLAALVEEKKPFQGQVALLPLGEADPEALLIVKSNIESFYGFSVTLLPGRGMPMPPVAQQAGEKVYNACELLNYLKSVRTEAFDKVIGITAHDITNPRKGVGTLGIGYLSGICCLVSTHGLKRDHPGAQKFSERLAKVSLHEIGHTLGLPHCSHSRQCLMNASPGTIRNVDREQKALCAHCAQALQNLLK